MPNILYQCNLNFFCFESKRNMRTFFLIIACIGISIDGVFTRTATCNSGNILWSKDIYLKSNDWNLVGTKCWSGGDGPIGICCPGLMCYHGYNPNHDGYCIVEPSPTCYLGNILWRIEIRLIHWNLAGTQCWTAAVGPSGTKSCCDGLTCFNGNSPWMDGYCVYL